MSCILTINGGSSSIKFALFSAANPTARLFIGQVQRIGLPDTTISATATGGTATGPTAIAAATHEQAADELINWLEPRLGGQTISAVGHRVVHGGIHLLQHQLSLPI